MAQYRWKKAEHGIPLRFLSKPPSPMGLFAALPRPITSRILQLALATNASARIILIRQKEGMVHGKNAILVTANSDTYRKLSEVSTYMSSGAKFTAFEMIDEKDLHIQLDFAGPALSPAMRHNKFLDHLRKRQCQTLLLSFIIVRNDGDVDSAGNITKAEWEARVLLRLAVNKRGSITATWEADEGEDEEIGSRVTRSHPVFEDARKAIEKLTSEGGMGYVDGYFLWRVMRVLEEAGKKYSIGDLK